MSFLAVLQVIGSLQLVSSCAVAVYAVAAWRRKGPARETPTPFGSVPETLKLLSDLQQPLRPPSRWKPQSPLARAEAELAREGELLQRGPSPATPLTSATTEREESRAPVRETRPAFPKAEEPEATGQSLSVHSAGSSHVRNRRGISRGQQLRMRAAIF